MDRDERQRKISAWTAAAFGVAESTNIAQRGIRLLEEAIEAYQACGGSVEMAHKLLDYVFARPVGALGQEIGGVSVCLLDKPVEHFAARNKAKNTAGFKAGG